MSVSVATTSGGPHPASFYVNQSIGKIIEIMPTASEARISSAQELREQIVTILREEFTNTQNQERVRLQREGKNCLYTPLCSLDEVMKIVDRIVEVAMGSGYDSFFKQDHVRSHHMNVIAHNISTLRDVERKWYINAHGA